MSQSDMWLHKDRMAAFYLVLKHKTDSYKQRFIEASRNDRKKCSFQSKLTFCQRMASERWECKCS